MIKGPKKIIHVIVPQELYEALKELAEAECRSIPGCIRTILREHLREM